MAMATKIVVETRIKASASAAAAGLNLSKLSAVISTNGEEEDVGAANSERRGCHRITAAKYNVICFRSSPCYLSCSYDS